MKSARSDETAPTAPRILVIEDSRVDRELLSLLLRKGGYEVCACGTLASGIAEIGTQTPDLIVLDEHLPDGRSSEHLDKIRTHAPLTPVVFVSGQADLATALAVSRQSVAAVFHKPIPARALLNKVRELLNGFSDAQTSAAAGARSPLESEPALDPRVEPENPLYCEHFPGVSAVHGVLRARLATSADFPHTLLLLGREGCVFWPVVRDLHAQGPHARSPLLPFGPRHFNASEVAARLARHVATAQSVTLAMERVDTYGPEQVRALSDLIKGHGEFSPYAGRLRIVMSAHHDFLEGSAESRFPAALAEQVADQVLHLPDFNALRPDRALLARRIILETGSSADYTLCDAAVEWLQNQRWPGDYAQFRRVILIAVSASNTRPLTAELLESALSIERSVPPDAYEITLPGLTEESRRALPTPPSTLGDLETDTAASPTAVSAPTPRTAVEPAPAPAKPLPKPRGRVGSYDFASRLRSSLDTPADTPAPALPVHPRFAPEKK